MLLGSKLVSWVYANNLELEYPRLPDLGKTLTEVPDPATEAHKTSLLSHNQSLSGGYLLSPSHSTERRGPHAHTERFASSDFS